MATASPPGQLGCGVQLELGTPLLAILVNIDPPEQKPHRVQTTQTPVDAR